MLFKITTLEICYFVKWVVLAEELENMQLE